MSESSQESKNFRNSLSTVNDAGKRVWVYPKKPSGRFYTARTIVSWFLLLFLFGAPFIKINGHPFIMLNLLERKFVIFAVPFGPHDFYIFLLGFIATIIFIFLFTAVYGRVFCGWACPQTVFLELVFRKIEYFIEGDANKQRQLDEMPWNSEKILKKGGKNIIFFSLSFLIANLFLSYIIGVDELYKIITDPPARHLSGLTAITIFSVAFYFVFAWFREQACTIVCPYGRLQGVLLDKNSLVVAYDHVRGEPRGKLKKAEDSSNGDCIDCALCVDVCPTGIDIRNGVQLECVNCTACIDACDNVMDKIKKPRGLVRYASLSGIEQKLPFKFTPRIMSYTFLLFLIVCVFSFFLITRADFSVNVLRTPGMLYQEQPGNKISNLYNINVVNKTFNDVAFEVKVKNLQAEIIPIGNDYKLGPQGIYEGKFMLVIDKDKIKRMNTPIVVGVMSNGKEIASIKSTFLGQPGVK